MPPPLRILFYSGSIGLGHVTRDLAIAGSLRELSPGVEIEWLASSPARELLAEAGEHLHSETGNLADATEAARPFMRPATFNITRWAVAVRKRWAADGRLVLSVIAGGGYDAFIGDEAYEVAMALTGGASHPGCPCFILYDFLGLDRMTLHPVEWIGVEAINRAWARDPGGHYQAVFLGELDDLPLSPFGRRGVSRRIWAERNTAIVGHALAFDPRNLPERARLRATFGYGSEPLLLVSVGGTAVGRALIERCFEAFPLVRKELPDIHMVVVTGPQLALTKRNLPRDVDILSYVPRLYEHFAACDLAIVQGGNATTLELTALQRPFLFFPLRVHCEQMKHVAARQKRLGAGVQLSIDGTSATDLSRHVLSALSREVHYPPLSFDGARETAQLVLGAVVEGATGWTHQMSEPVRPCRLPAP